MLNAVIDLSHHQNHVNFVKVKAAGIVGVIHKATQGLAYIDPRYTARVPLAASVDLLWGAYHFGINGDGIKQADFFLNAVQPTDQTLLVLDYEPSYNTMTLAQARAFVQQVRKRTGRYPGLYSGSLIKEQLGGKPADPILRQCWLWIAQYGPKVKNIPQTWDTWTLWQYTDGADGPPPRSCDGVGFCDRDQFNGDLDDLKRLWNVA